jgi:hypothetical protein
MKVKLCKANMSELPGIIAIFQNVEKTITIKVLDDVSYEITRNGYTQKCDLKKWYLVGSQVIQHINNDVKEGYYPGVKRVA